MDFVFYSKKTETSKDEATVLEVRLLVGLQGLSAAPKCCAALS